MNVIGRCARLDDNGQWVIDLDLLDMGNRANLHHEVESEVRWHVSEWATYGNLDDPLLESMVTDEVIQGFRDSADALEIEGEPVSWDEETLDWYRTVRIPGWIEKAVRDLRENE